MRRRARFLRKARELAYRDLGGLVFDLHRFGRRNDQVVLAKLATLRQIDAELRSLEQALRDRRPVTVLREVGIAACPRCAAIHGSDDRFCPGCGLAFDTNAERPISTAPITPRAQRAQTPAPASAPAPLATPQAPGEASPAPSRPAPAPAYPAPAQAPSPPARGPIPSVGHPVAPKAEPGPPVKPTAAPFPARPASSEPPKRDPRDEDAPTEILRPPATGT